MTQAELTKAKLRRLNSVPDDFLAKIPKAEAEIFDQVIELLGRLQIKNGAYVVSSKNLTIASDIAVLLRQVLLGSEYTKYVTEFVKEFDQQAVVNNSLFEKTFPEFTTSELAKQVNNIAKRDAIDLLLNRASDTDFIAPLRGVIENAVINGAGYRETVKSIRLFIEGDPERLGALSRYSKTYSHDTFAIADRSYTSVVAEELGAEWFLYAGDEIVTTRPFCDERHGRYFHYLEIEGWAEGKRVDGEGTPDNDGDWSGKVPGTNSATIYSYAGGFNCRHSILPVSLFSVPMDVIQRNIESGNYEPTEKELELLGL